MKKRGIGCEKMLMSVAVSKRNLRELVVGEKEINDAHHDFRPLSLL